MTFKAMIYEILDHRLRNAEEIDGGVNNTFMSFDEHLIVFMMQRHGTRVQTELQLVDFLSSLKYYAEQWQRAKVFTQILGFYQSDDSFMPVRKSGNSETRLPPRMNDGVIDELEETYFDIYQQEFYLHCYSLITKNHKHF